MIRCRVVRRASWAARGAGRRARAASSCAWSMIRGSGVVTGIVCLGSVAGFGAGTGPVGELWSLCWVRPLSCSSELFVESASAVQVEAGRRTHLWRRLGGVPPGGRTLPQRARLMSENGHSVWGRSPVGRETTKKKVL